MLKITYKEYLKYEELNRKNNNYNQVKEESENYTYDKNNEHDKVFRDLLNIKEEALILINKALKPRKEIEEEIELYNSRFITSKYKDRESDIIYKVKNKNIFFIIEHQSTIDYSMVYRMLEYSIEIMRQIIQGKENKRKTYKYPLIIPIVIYTGDKKWDAKLSMKEIKEKAQWYEEQEDISLVDINEYTKEELLEEKNLLSKVMLLEKSKNEAEFIENVEEILEIADDRNIDKLKDIIIYKAYDALEQEELEEMLNKMKNKKEESIMTLGERIRRNEREERMKARNEGKIEGIKEGINEGRMEGITEAINTTIKKMLLLKLDEDIIKEVTGAKDNELQKLKKELQGV